MAFAEQFADSGEELEVEVNQKAVVKMRKKQKEKALPAPELFCKLN